MTISLRESTAGQKIPLGYFLDSTDGDTEETGLTIANTDIKLWKWGATSLANKNSGGATHISNGIFYCTLDATDSNTVGPMVVFVHVSGALTVRVECDVLPANVWDSRYGSDLLDVNVSKYAESDAAVGASSGFPKTDVHAWNNAATVVTNMVTVYSTDFATNYDTTRDCWNVNVDFWLDTAVTLSGNSKPDVNVDEWHDVSLGTTNPLPNAAADAAGGLPISDAGGLDLDTLLGYLTGAVATAASLSTLDGKVDVIGGIVDDILVDTGTTLPATLSTIEGKIDTVDGVVDAVLVDTGTTLPATLATIAGYIDAEVAAILEDTGTTIPALIAALNDLDAAGVRSAVGLASDNLDTQLGDIPTVSEFEARTLLAAAYFDASTDKVSLANGAHGGAAASITLSDYSDFQGGAGSAPTVVEIWAGFDSTQLAKFVTVDTGETTAAAGSVAKIAQGSAGGNVTVESFTTDALAMFATEDTGETAAGSGTVCALAQASPTVLAGGSTGTTLVGGAMLAHKSVYMYDPLGSWDFDIYDIDGNLLNVDGNTFELRIWEKGEVDTLIAVISTENVGSPITVSGSTVTVDTTSSVTETGPRTLVYALRDVTNNNKTRYAGDLDILEAHGTGT